jgi:hypothetical protein
MPDRNQKHFAVLSLELTLENIQCSGRVSTGAETVRMIKDTEPVCNKVLLLLKIAHTL